MRPLALSINLHIGGIAPEPAPLKLVEAIDSVQVTQRENSPSGFQITFRANRDPFSASADYDLLQDGLVQPGNRVIISVVLNGTSKVLHDGFIDHQELQPGMGKGYDHLIVTGKDVSVMMNLVEYSLEYPMMGDFAIAGMVLLKWAVVGVIPMVIPTPSSFVSLEETPQQISTDLDYLQQLASQHGNIFCIIPGPVVGTNVAYWGPPPRILAPQKTLTANVAVNENVSDLSFTYDHLSPQFVYSTELAPIGDVELPVATFTSTRLPPFATQPALDFTSLFQRRTLFNHQDLDFIQAMTRAQNITDVSTDQVVVAKGALDGLRYGDILAAPGVVGVRGVGHSYDGLYYVQEVTHTLGRGEYKQEFTLTREGLGSTVDNLPP